MKKKALKNELVERVWFLKGEMKRLTENIHEGRWRPYRVEGSLDRMEDTLRKMRSALCDYRLAEEREEYGDGD